MPVSEGMKRPQTGSISPIVEETYHYGVSGFPSSGGWRAGQVLSVSAVLFLYAELYFGTFVKLVHDWYTLPDFSHGFLIPFFVGYVLWKQKDELRRLPLVPSWYGLGPLLFGLALLLLGQLGAELYLARISFLFVMAATVVLVAGARFLRRLWFPISLLMLAIPIPQVIFYQLTAPLQHLAATCATHILPLFGVPVLQEGNVIRLPSVSLEVAEACSGIRSLLSLATLSIVYSYFTEREWWRKILLLLFSIPTAVAANTLRIVGTGVLVHYRGASLALGFFHEFSGLLVFAVSVGMLMGIHVLLHRLPVRG